MKAVFYLVLVLGIGLAGGAVYLANDFIGAQQAALAKERELRERIGPVVEVLVTEKPLRYGDPLTPEDVRLVIWPQEAVPEGAFLTMEELFPQGEDLPRIALRAMEKDEALMAVKVTEPGEDAGVSSRLTKGMRAFAISVDVSTGVSGFLRPGDRVDVYWTGRLPGNTRDTGNVTKLIQANMRLVAIDQKTDKDSNNPTIARTVTVEATPEQVAGLATAQSTGKLSLALVGNSDDTVVSAVEIDQRTLLGIVTEEAEPEVVETVEAPRVCTVRTRRGSDIVVTEIPCTN